MKNLVFVLALIVSMLVVTPLLADDFDALVSKVEAKAKPKPKAEETRQGCKCPDCLCGDDCQCQYPGQCRDEAEWSPSPYSYDPGYFLFVGNRLVGGLYPSGTYIPFCNGKWGQPCKCPVAKPKAGTRCGPNGCKVGYFGDCCQDGSCLGGNCGSSCGSCGQAEGGCSSGNCAGAESSGAGAGRHPVRNLVHRIFHRGGGRRGGGCSSCQ